MTGTFDFYVSDTAMQLLAIIPTLIVYLFILYKYTVKKKIFVVFGIVYVILALMDVYDEHFIITGLFCMGVLFINRMKNTILIVAVTAGFILVDNSFLLIHSNQETLFYMMVKLAALQCAFFLYQLYELWKRRTEHVKYLLLFQSIFYVFCFGVCVLLILYNTNMKKGMREVIYFPVFAITVLYLGVSVLFDFFQKNQIVQEKLNLQKEKNEMVNKQYQVLKQKYEDISILKHDTKHHLQTLAILLYQNQVDKAKVYIQSFSDYMNENTFAFRSTSQILEIIINEKYLEAKAKGIRMELDCEDFSMNRVDDVDMITIFANVLDNAIEAVEVLETERYIEVKLARKEHYIVFEVVNPYDGRVEEENHRFRTTKPGHDGLGIRSVRKTVTKYSGMVQMDYEGGIFTTTVLLPVRNCMMDNK